MKKRIHFIFVLSSLFFILGCSKKVSSGNGTNTMIYQRSYENHYKIDVASMVQTETFIIGDVDVYQDVLGQVAKNVFGNATNGKVDWVRDIEVSGLKLSSNLKIGLINDNSNLSSNLVNCQLFYTYYPTDNSGQKTIVLANFVNYSSSGQEAILQSTGEDLTSLFKNEGMGGQFKLVFKFGTTPHTVGKMRLWYTLPFDYSYVYSSKPASKKE